MKKILLLGLFAGTLAHAYAVNEVAGRSYKCDSLTLSFDKKAETATVGGKTYNVEWGNRAIDAVIGDHDFNVLATNRYTLDGEPCRLQR